MRIHARVSEMNLILIFGPGSVCIFNSTDKDAVLHILLDEMINPRYCTRSAIDTDTIDESNAESESDSDISDIDYNAENSEESDSETESEPDSGQDVTAASSVDPLFIAKNKMEWSATPLPQPIRTVAENIMSKRPGPTLFAVSRCCNIKSAFLLFFPPTIEKIIIENTNKYGRVKFSNKWRDMDEATLRAYIAVLILAGVYRYVDTFFLFQ